MKRKDIADEQPETITHHKPNGKRQSTSLRCSACLIFLTMIGFAASAQIPPAWVAKYNNGIANGTNQAVKMALDSSGNIYVTGFSLNTNGNLGYVTLKYAANGYPVWAARLDSTNYPSAQPAGMVLDGDGNVIVTGTAGTVKYDSNGNQLWAAPYAGTALAVDTNGNTYVIGFSSNFATVKLNPSGTNLWVTTYTNVGPTVAQMVAVDSNGNVYVSGSDVWYELSPGVVSGSSCALTTIKYDANGQKLWKTSFGQFPTQAFTVVAAGIDSRENFIVSFNQADVLGQVNYASDGNLNWQVFLEGIYGVPCALALDSLDNLLVSGSLIDTPTTGNNFATIKFNSNGLCVWTNIYQGRFPWIGPGAATATTVDQANNVYSTGYVYEPTYTNGTNGYPAVTNLVTIKYDNNGNQVWLQQYTPPRNAGGNAVGNAIAVDAFGNVYVTGYESTEAGGTEIVTIKYSPIALQRLTNGAVLLQTQGFPGQFFDIEASTNLQTWQNIGNVTGDANGLAIFNDTNATNFDWRFYLSVPQ